MRKTYTIIINKDNKKTKKAIDHDTFLRLVNKYKQDTTCNTTYAYSEQHYIVNYKFIKGNDSIVLIMKGAE